MLAKFPISSIALDAIEGLPSVDFLVLDEKHDNISILQSGKRTLKDTLLVQVRVPFNPLYHGGSDTAQVGHWMSRNGFRLHSLARNHFRSRFSDKSTLEKIKATELMSSDVLFLPTEKRLREMSDDRLLKLSYILHIVYGMHDMAYEVLCKVSPDLGESVVVK